MTEDVYYPLASEGRRILGLVLFCLLAAAPGCGRASEDKTEEPELEEYTIVLPGKISDPIQLGAAAPPVTVEVSRTKGTGDPKDHLPLKVTKTPSLLTAELAEPNSIPTTLEIKAVAEATDERLRKASWRGGEGQVSDWVCVDLSVDKSQENIDSESDCIEVTVVLDEAAKESLSEIKKEGPRIFIARDEIAFGDAKVGQATIFLELSISNHGQGILDVTVEMDPLSQDFRIAPPASFSLKAAQTQRVGLRFQPTTKGLTTANLKISSSDVQSPVKNVILRGVGEQG